MLRLNTIKAQPGSVTSRKRLGRGQGSGLGKTAGKGHKGQLARTGGSVRPGFEGGQSPLYRRLGKFGFTNPGARAIAIVNLVQLEKLSASQYPEITLESLTKARVLKGRFDRLNVLGNGELTKKFVVKAHKVSASALAKIEKAGGKVELLPIPAQAKHTIERKDKKNSSKK